MPKNKTSKRASDDAADDASIALPPDGDPAPTEEMPQTVSAEPDAAGPSYTQYVPPGDAGTVGPEEPGRKSYW